MRSATQSESEEWPDMLLELVHGEQDHKTGVSFAQVLWFPPAYSESMVSCVITFYEKIITSRTAFLSMHR